MEMERLKQMRPTPVLEQLDQADRLVLAKNRELLSKWRGIENQRRLKSDMWAVLEEAEIT